MPLNEPVIENVMVRRRVEAFPRSPLQLNGLGESDAELVRLSGTGLLLAVTTDAIVEEIEVGLYRDPWLIGWMTIVASASDLAAVGADPLGVVLNQTLPPDLDPGWEMRLQTGIRRACSACDLFLLGGDSNSSDRIHMQSTAIGTVPTDEAMLRTGGRPGDHLFVSGSLGLGSVFAAEALAGPSDGPGLSFRPIARLREGQHIRTFASCCMDTSDGAIATLDELMLRNGFGVQLTRPVSELLHPAAAAWTERAGVPAWIPLAGPHGEFELVFSVPPTRLDSFRSAMSDAGILFLPLGIAREEPGLVLAPEDGSRRLETAAIRNLGPRAAEDPRRYVAQVMSLESRA